jgi:hypothetical protein
MHARVDAMNCTSDLLAALALDKFDFNFQKKSLKKALPHQCVMQHSCRLHYDRAL